MYIPNPCRTITNYTERWMAIRFSTTTCIKNIAVFYEDVFHRPSIQFKPDGYPITACPAYHNTIGHKNWIYTEVSIIRFNSDTIIAATHKTIVNCEVSAWNRINTVHGVYGLVTEYLNIPVTAFMAICQSVGPSFSIADKDTADI